jgi:hypothetical protein
VKNFRALYFRFRIYGKIIVSLHTVPTLLLSGQSLRF